MNRTKWKEISMFISMEMTGSHTWKKSSQRMKKLSGSTLQITSNVLKLIS